MRLKIIKNHRIVLCEKTEHTVAIFLYKVYVILQMRCVDDISKRFKSAHCRIDKGEYHREVGVIHGASGFYGAAVKLRYLFCNGKTESAAACRRAS